MKVGMKIRDERAFRRISDELGELGIECINLNRVPCSDVDVALLDEEAAGSTDETVRKCVREIYGRFGEVIIGIDPGPRPGVAVFGDGKHVCGSRFGGPEKASAFVRRALNIFEYDSYIIRVGNGAGVYRNRIINDLLPLRLELVDEKGTSGRGDIEAAKRIAFLRGSPVREPMGLEPGEGEIREIQNESRSISGVTISRDLARGVAEGNIEMSEAIKKQKGEQKNEADSVEQG